MSSALTIIALEAVLRLLRTGQVDQAEEYAQSALDALRAEPSVEPSHEPPEPSSPAPVNGGGASPIADWDRSRALARKRAQQYRANRKAARNLSGEGADRHVTSVTESVTRHVTDPPASRDASRDERDASRDVFPLSRSPSFSHSLFLSETLQREEGRAREGTGEKSSRDERDASRDGERVTGVTRHVTELAKSSFQSRRPSRPPPSETSAELVAMWCTERGLDPAHPSMARFLDIRRNAKAVTDWAACWRLFLEDEASGRFEAKSGVRRAQTDLASHRERLRREEMAQDEAYSQRMKGAGAPPEPLTVTMARLRASPGAKS